MMIRNMKVCQGRNYLVELGYTMAKNCMILKFTIYLHLETHSFHWIMKTH